MKIIYLALVIVLVAASQNIEIISNPINHLKETIGVLKCINDIDTKLTINSVSKFCGEEYSENAECYSAYSNFKLCLINNNCQQDINEPSVNI
jgi:hypothetical protein